jgi:hypothetical protein
MSDISVRVQRLKAIGFSEEAAEKIVEGEEEDVLSEKELMKFMHAFETDKIEPMEPLVEKYGWMELFDRFRNSIE